MSTGLWGLYPSGGYPSFVSIVSKGSALCLQLYLNPTPADKSHPALGGPTRDRLHSSRVIVPTLK